MVALVQEPVRVVQAQVLENYHRGPFHVGKRLRALPRAYASFIIGLISSSIVLLLS
jgi:hypothetical protein